MKKIEEDWRPLKRKWRTEREQKIYTSKLLDALRRVRCSTRATKELRPSRVIREVADRTLAVAARGRTRWSRSILAARKINLNRRRVVPCGRSVSRKGGGRMLEGKAGVLGRLVPGGRKLSFPMLLEEASDYIAALQMQVCAMTALTTILSASGGTTPEADFSAP